MHKSVSQSLSLSIYLSICLSIYLYIYLYIYIFIYKEKERECVWESERDSERVFTELSGKEPHRHVGIDGVMTSKCLDDVMVSLECQKCKLESCLGTQYIYKHYIYISTINRHNIFISTIYNSPFIYIYIYIYIWKVLFNDTFRAH